jgi:hypothetical protein
MHSAIFQHTINSQPTETDCSILLHVQLETRQPPRIKD